MKFLVITQKVDKNDDVLGFFHGWIRELAKSVNQLIVICLEKGEYNLPENVKVLSLGKERPDKTQGRAGDIARLGYVWNFYKHIWQERKNYDAVLVHMNKEYVILGGLLWRLTGKRIMLWYNHKKGNWLSSLAGRLASTIFYTSPFSYFSGWKKAKIMPAGIDTNLHRLKPDAQAPKNSLLSLGRISPVKNLDVLIGAGEILESAGVDFTLNIAGAPGKGDEKYYNDLREECRALEKKGRIKFLGSVPNRETPAVFNASEIFINLTDSGSLDKTTLEAMASERLVLASNKTFEKIFPREWHEAMIFKEGDANDLSRKIIKLMAVEEGEKNAIKKESRKIVIENHSLVILIDKILAYLKN
jgi:glycosyltransferase involved in cell wall biosynthesis